MNDTIAAISTPFGEGAIAMLRLSGERAVMIADEVFRAKTTVAALTSRVQQFGKIADGAQTIDDVMLSVHRALGRHSGARLLLQVHDELLLECPAGEAEAVTGMVRREMQGCYPLRVPLTVSVGTGPTWFDVH